MPSYISVEKDFYGVWSNEDGTIVGDAVPAAKKVGDISAKINKLQKDHVAQAKRK